MSTIKKETYLWNELMEYETHTEMTDEERVALHEWVLEGHSVHENWAMACTESGSPTDFLEIYRYEEEIRHELARLSPREQENYLAKLRGEDTMDTLKEDFNELFFKSTIYEQLLHSYGLMEKAEQLIKEAKERSLERSKIFEEWIVAHPEEELPFE